MADTKKTKKPAEKKAAKAEAPEAKKAAAQAEAPQGEAKAARKARPGAPAAGPHASLHFLRVAPRKVRLVADEVRGLKVGDALAMLKYVPQAAAEPLAKLLRSAVANAEQKGGRVDVDALFVKTLTVDQGPKMRRFMARAMGRAYRVEKKTSHVYVELGTA
jgi:large subunit ribosomal protein L22